MERTDRSTLLVARWLVLPAAFIFLASSASIGGAAPLAPPIDCASNPNSVKYNVGALDDQISVFKQGLRTYLYTPDGTGSECIRHNSIELVTNITLYQPEVEFGWGIGWNCMDGLYWQHPQLFYTYVNTSFEYHCIQLSGSPSPAAWHWYKIVSNLNTTFTFYLDGVAQGTTPPLGDDFSAGIPLAMNSERLYDKTGTPTSNWGNFDVIQEYYGGVWQNLVTPTCNYHPAGDTDPDYFCQMDPNSPGGNHFRSCHDPSPCPP